MFKISKIKSLFLVACLIGSVSLFAQEKDISEKELGHFADAYLKVQMQNQEAQKEMMAIIEKEGLKVERFSEIQEASMDANKTLDATEDEKSKHAKAIAKMEAMQPALEKKAVENIESAGITIERYQSMSASIQKEKALQQRLQALLVERSGN
ncbi:DUF4168 domain-containing protein [Gelidibacter mesophilus]|uniref:DUF4168 domain-containing protein n=1 Tax=Gelidibacter mesophilus TaxID=169050 RepID=UPI0003FD9CB9|nr:DUF4168 domain-containing protein [Gelidibacter mesophilus]